MISTCTGCNKEYKDNRKGQWWNCNNYFGISGFFCPSCYDMISHDPWKKPRNFAAYSMMLLRFGK